MVKDLVSVKLSAKLTDVISEGVSDLVWDPAPGHASEITWVIAWLTICPLPPDSGIGSGLGGGSGLNNLLDG